ncbi:hypothetical protein ACFL27_18365 [candidate division CSSED10-310 bacterium]|uniref:Phospholipase/carboxylesterase/thioesterase domain-containing protein n=1 Tax=candidate division CSSED10-310 bacterium TaxID=2855610 RepID=A0ABV6Z1I1_UNCC1
MPGYFTARICIWITISALIFPAVSFADWQADLTTLITMDQPDHQLLKKIVRADPDYWEVMTVIENLTFKQPEQTKHFTLRHYTGLDGESRPFVVYIPSAYDAQKPTPLLVYLHGGVSHKDIEEDPLKYARENEFVPVAEKENWLLLFPFGQGGATWWDEVGMNNILGEIKAVKRKFNVDDDQVALTGFSDGASGSFSLAMLLPDTFSCFIPLNGHIGVASIDGKLPLYVSNLTTTPLHVINTDIDRLYPSKSMKPMLDLAANAGADIEFKVYQGIGHDFDYAPRELPFIVKFIKAHPRNPFLSSLTWEASHPAYNRRLWIQIDTIADTKQAPWHFDYKLRLVNERVMFGFIPDEKYTGKGVKIATVPQGESLCNQLKLKAGDVFLQGDSIEINNIDDLNTFKQTKKRGDPVQVLILRENQELELSGSFPPPEEYDLFLIEKSGRIKATKQDNAVMLQTSRVAKCSLYVHPSLFQLDQPIVVSVEQTKIFEGKIKPDLEFALGDFLHRRDRKVIYCNKIYLDLAGQHN